MPTIAADWDAVSSGLGRAGTMSGPVYRVPIARSDLAVSSQGVALKPALALGGYAAFTRYADTTLMMGDLVVTEAELPAVTDALQAQGIAQTALHKHLLEQNPPVWWTHVHAMGDPAQLAGALRAALAVTATPTPPAPAPAPSTPATSALAEFDAAGVAAALGRAGTAEGGVYKITAARADTIREDGRVLPAGTGVTTAVNFQPLGGGRTAVNGDIVMVGQEVQKVIAALRGGGVQIVEVHNHGLTEQPRLFYLHFWGVNDAVTVARALRPALDATNLRPGP